MKQKYKVQGMSCSSCQAHVQKAVESLDGASNVNVNLLTGEMYLDFDESKLNDKMICDAVKKAGYTCGKIETQVKDNQKLKLILSIIFSLVLMYVAMGNMLGLPLPSFMSGTENAVTYSVVQLVLALVVIFINNHYYINGFKHLFKFMPNMDSLIAIGSGASVIYGIYAIIMIIIGDSAGNIQLVETYYHNLYFDSAAMILTLVSFGKYLEHLSKKKTNSAISKLVKLSPSEAVVLIDGVETTIPTSEVKLDDIVIVKVGKVVPVDGIIVKGSASFDQSTITGESIPVFKKEGDEVISSTILLNGYVEFKANKVGEDTTIQTIIKLVSEASSSKAPISKLVDKIARVFVPFVISISLITFLIFLIAYDIELALRTGISVLVISCPCALGLATPVAIMVGTGKAAESGLLIKSAEVLENASKIKTVIFDKTGTITTGEPIIEEVIDYQNDESKLIKIAYLLEKKSSHPLSKAVISYAEKGKEINGVATDYHNFDGEGISGIVENKRYYIGSMGFVKRILNCSEKHVLDKYEELSSKGKTVIAICDDLQILGLISIADKIKQNSSLGVEKLRAIGIKTIMLTGDNVLTAKAVAKDVGIDEVIAGVLPTQKQDVIKKVKSESDGLVCMVGDGVNDALALTTADCGIAIGNGTDIAIDSSDIVLMHNDILDVPKVILLSKRVMSKIKVNLFWAFFYNVIGIFLAAGVLYKPFGLLLNPMIAAGAMSLSSVFVVMNSLSINLFKINQIKEEEKMNYTFIVSSMACAKCQERIENALRKMEGITDVKVNLEEKLVTVTTDTKVLKESKAQKKIIAVLKKTGYDAEIR